MILCNSSAKLSSPSYCARALTLSNKIAYIACTGICAAAQSAWPSHSEHHHILRVWKVYTCDCVTSRVTRWTNMSSGRKVPPHEIFSVLYFCVRVCWKLSNCSVYPGWSFRVLLMGSCSSTVKTRLDLLPLTEYVYLHKLFGLLFLSPPVVMDD